MPDASKRRGCDVCRKRHIKCDRQDPACSQCIRAGWKCPGYPADISFVNYSQNFPTGRSRAASSRSREARQQKGARSANLESQSTSSGSKASSTDLVPVPKIQPKATPSVVPYSSTDIIRHEFVAALESKSLAAAFETLDASSYLRFLPAAVGQSSCLDDAVKFIALASRQPVGQREVGSGANSEIMLQYGHSMMSLRDAIGDVNQVNHPGTLAAALLHQMYEVHCSLDSPARVFHANGVTKLIQHRGPDAFKDDIDLAILEAQSANIIFVSMREGTPCFLAQPKWNNLLTGIAKGKEPGPGRMPAPQLELMGCWCLLPGAIRGFHDFLDEIYAGSTPSDTSSVTVANASVEQDSNRWALLYNYLSTARWRLQSWRKLYTPIAEKTEPSRVSVAYEVINESASTSLLAMVDYMLATVMPMVETEYFSIDAELLSEVDQLMEVVRYYTKKFPRHPFFARGPVRNSVALAWIKTKDHKPGVVSACSESIAELINLALTPEP